MGGILIRWIFNTCVGDTWAGSSWLRIGTGNGLLWMRWWTFGFRKMRGISWKAENRLDSAKGLCSNYLVMNIFVSAILCRTAINILLGCGLDIPRSWFDSYASFLQSVRTESGYKQPLIPRVKSSPVTGLEWPRGFQEVKVPRFHDNGTGWW